MTAARLATIAPLTAKEKRSYKDFVGGSAITFMLQCSLSFGLTHSGDVALQALKHIVDTGRLAALQTIWCKRAALHTLFAQLEGVVKMAGENESINAYAEAWYKLLPNA
jgi:hypothetical protein